MSTPDLPLAKNQPVRVILFADELEAGVEAGKARQFDCMRNLRKSGLNDRADAMKQLRHHILGACGELAFAKFIGNEDALTVNTFKSIPDVAGYEVRTREKPSQDIIVRDSDDSERTFVLVTSSSRPPATIDGQFVAEFYIWGWIKASSAKQGKYTANYGGYGACYSPPKEALRPVRELLGEAA